MSLTIIMARSEKDQYGRYVHKEKFFTHPKGWIILRFKDRGDAKMVSNLMNHAALNACLIFDIEHRYQEVLKRGVDTDIETGLCAPTLIRSCMIDGLGIDPGLFLTRNEVRILSKTGLFEEPFEYKSKVETPLMNGDILVTKTPGTTGMIVIDD